MISPLEGDTKESELHKKHTDLKQKMRDINHAFERLRKLSHEGFTEDSGERGENHTPFIKTAPLLISHVRSDQIRRALALEGGSGKEKGQISASRQRCTAGPINLVLFISENIHFLSSDSFLCSVLRV